MFVIVQVLDLRKLRTLLMALLRFLRKVLLRKRLTRSRRSLRLRALRLLLSNFDTNNNVRFGRCQAGFFI